MKKNNLPSKHCANYNSGHICSGVIINKDLRQLIEKDLADKPCIVREGKECDYFNKCVKPII